MLLFILYERVVSVNIDLFNIAWADVACTICMVFIHLRWFTTWRACGSLFDLFGSFTVSETKLIYYDS